MSTETGEFGCTPSTDPRPHRPESWIRGCTKKVRSRGGHRIRGRRLALNISSLVLAKLPSTLRGARSQKTSYAKNTQNELRKKRVTHKTSELRFVRRFVCGWPFAARSGLQLAGCAVRRNVGHSHARPGARGSHGRSRVAAFRGITTLQRARDAECDVDSQGLRIGDHPNRVLRRTHSPTPPRCSRSPPPPRLSSRPPRHSCRRLARPCTWLSGSRWIPVSSTAT